MDFSFRVRHLQSISVRNLNVSIIDLSRSSIFFALSTADEDNLGYFYQSLKCDNILNPYWENLDLSYDNIRRFSFLDNFIITFFIFQNSKNKIFAEIKIHISGLSPLSSLYHSKKDENHFLFQFNNTLYSFDIDEPTLRNKLSIDISKKVKTPKIIYSRDTIDKFMFTLSDEYQQNVYSISTKRQNLETQIYDCKHTIGKINIKRNTILSIKSQLELAKKIKEVKSKELFQLTLANTKLREKIERVEDNSQNVTIDISRNNTLLRRYKDSYLKTSNEYMLRMYQLIHELARVYPITPSEPPLSTISKSSSNNAQSTTITIRSSDKLSIVNLHLPNSDKQIVFTQDVSSFAALGMVFKLLGTLSQIYDIPLRYPMFSIGVKAIIRDNIIDIDDQERNFLLIKNSSENFRLQYAIYLLNLNIVAIRGYFSLSTKYPENTLWNINTLIEGKNRLLGSSSSDDGSNSGSTISVQLPTKMKGSQQSPKPSYKLSPLATKSHSAIN